jgi:GT2 family glycosyltransferase
MINYFSLIICTYKRPEPLYELLNSVKTQTIIPNEILIIDGSPDNKTKELFSKKSFTNLKYYKVDETDRGLTKQRNFGIKLVNESSEIICFLDDDTILTENYFQELISTYDNYKDAIAVGGYIINESEWSKQNNTKNLNSFYFDGWSRKEPLRFKIRKWFGLLPDTDPGYLPTFSHGRSIGFLPPSGKIYKVEQLMGGVSSFKKEIFEKLMFSKYFEGYGLYEDTDFSLRVSKIGQIYINTNAKLSHYHDDSGRPNKFKYGRMVVRNGWYIWRVKYPKPTIKARIKWNLTSLLLTKIRFLNVINTTKRLEAFTEGLGRVSGWFSLIFNKPKFEE